MLLNYAKTKRKYLMNKHQQTTTSSTDVYSIQALRSSPCDAWELLIFHSVVLHTVTTLKTALHDLSVSQPI